MSKVFLGNAIVNVNLYLSNGTRALGLWISTTNHLLQIPGWGTILCSPEQGISTKMLNIHSRRRVASIIHVQKRVAAMASRTIKYVKVIDSLSLTSFENTWKSDLHDTHYKLKICSNYVINLHESSQETKLYRGLSVTCQVRSTPSQSGQVQVTGVQIIPPFWSASVNTEIALLRADFKDICVGSRHKSTFTENS